MSESARDLGVVILTNGFHGRRVFGVIAAAYYDNQRFTHHSKPSTHSASEPTGSRRIDSGGVPGAGFWL